MTSNTLPWSYWNAQPLASSAHIEIGLSAIAHGKRPRSMFSAARMKLRAIGKRLSIGC